MTTHPSTELLEDAELETESGTRWSAQPMVAARRGNLEARLLLTRALLTAETLGRSESQEGDPLHN